MKQQGCVYIKISTNKGGDGGISTSSLDKGMTGIRFNTLQKTRHNPFYLEKYLSILFPNG